MLVETRGCGKPKGRRIICCEDDDGATKCQGRAEVDQPREERKLDAEWAEADAAPPDTDQRDGSVNQREGAPCSQNRGGARSSEVG